MSEVRINELSRRAQNVAEKEQSEQISTEASTAALSPAHAGSDWVRWTPTWGLRPRLYASARDRGLCTSAMRTLSRIRRNN